MNVEVGTIAWIRTASDAEYEAAIDFLIQQTKTVFQNNVLALYYTHNEQTRNNLLVALQVARDLTKTRDFRSTPTVLRNSIFKNTVKILRICDSHSYSPASHGKSDRITSKSNRIRKRLNTAHQLALTQTKGKEHNSNGLMNAVMGAKNKIAAPSFSAEFPQLDAKLRKLQKTYAIAEECITTTEEKYFMEQIMTSYLPNIAKTMAAVRHSSPDIRNKVEDELTKQVTLIGKKLRVIIDSSGLRALREAEAQTDFLSQKLTPTVNALQLSKASEMNIPKALLSKQEQGVVSLH